MDGGYFSIGFPMFHDLKTNDALTMSVNETGLCFLVLHRTLDDGKRVQTQKAFAPTGTKEEDFRRSSILIKEMTKELDKAQDEIAHSRKSRTSSP